MGNAKSDLLIVILLVIMLGIAWVWTGGPTHVIAHQGGLFSAPWPLGPGGNAYTVPTIPLGDYPTSTDTGASTEAPVTPSKTSIFDYFFGYRAGGNPTDPSPSAYSSYVRLDRGGATNQDPKAEYITLYTSGSLQNSITITGWSLQSASGVTKFVIGSASQIPAFGDITTDAPITIGPNSTVTITTGPSPKGMSFRLNECTGYFSQFQTFSPTLPRECPRPRDEMIANPAKTANNPECETFVNNLSQCTLTIDAIPGKVGSDCTDFVLNTLSYNGCILKHKNDPDFYRNEWRVFLNRNQEIWNNNHDRILLLDENGKLVASVSY